MDGCKIFSKSGHRGDFDTINSRPMIVWEFVINFRTGILLKYQYGKGKVFSSKASTS